MEKLNLWFLCKKGVHLHKTYPTIGGVICLGPERTVLLASEIVLTLTKRHTYTAILLLAFELATQPYILWWKYILHWSPWKTGFFALDLSVSRFYFLTIFSSTLSIPPHPRFISCHYGYYHTEKWSDPPLSFKEFQARKRLVWNLLHLWRSEQSCSAGGLGKRKSLFSLNATDGAAADSFPTASIIFVGWALGINRLQSPVGPEHAQLNVKSLTKVAMHSHLVNSTAAKPFGFLFFVLRIEG